jgi:NADPH:quinone reductase-like Zn-dependent oxidoreductase
VVTYLSVSDYKRVLSPGGVYVMLGGGSYSRVFRNILLGSLSTLKEYLILGKAGRKMGLLMHKPNKNDLQYLTGLFETGKIAPVIDKRFRLNEVAEAFRYYGEDLARGKVVITV